MYSTFNDENAKKMRDVAKTIQPAERFATGNSDLSKAGPIASQFFPQKEMNINPLDTDAVILEMAGGEDAKDMRFRTAMRSMYPNSPEMWSLKPPSAAPKERTFMGGMFIPTPEKAQSGALSKSSPVASESDRRFIELGAAIARLEALKAVKACIDAGQLTAEAVAGALAAA
jgi:hypothetical protein